MGCCRMYDSERNKLWPLKAFLQHNSSTQKAAAEMSTNMASKTSLLPSGGQKASHCNAQFHQTLSPLHVRCSTHVQAYFPTPTQASHPPGDRVTACSFWCCLFTNQSTHTLSKTKLLSPLITFSLKEMIATLRFQFWLI